MHIHRSKSEPNRAGLSWEERWEQADRGLILCWECGRTQAAADPALAERARAGELMVLSWKGGVSTAQKKKYGTLMYLAKLQGLRGDDLDIWTDRNTELACTKTKTRVTFTPNLELVD